MEEVGEILYIDAADEPFYNETSVFPAKGDNRLSNTEKFLLAMAYGFRNRAEKEITRRVGGGFFRRSYLQPEHYALIYSVISAHTGGDPGILLDQARVLQIAQRLAHGGAVLAQTDPDFKKGCWVEKLEESIFQWLERKDDSNAEKTNTAG
jgi:hypothetical protein